MANATYLKRMIPTANDLLKEIDEFLIGWQMSDGAFSRAAVGNSKWLSRLRDNLRRGTGDIKLTQAARVRAFLNQDHSQPKANLIRIVPITVRRNNGKVASKLKDTDIIGIRNDDRTHAEIAADYGVKRTTITMVKLRKSWQHIP